VIEIRDLRENRLSVTPDRTLARNPFRANLPRRGGLRTPVMTHSASPGYAPARPPAFRLLLAGHAIPGLAYGLATRARRPRPSDKTIFAVTSGLSPQGHLTLFCPLEGRAPHARKEGSGLIGASPYRGPGRWPGHLG